MSVCRSTSRIAPRSARSRSSTPKITSAGVGAECTTTTSAPPSTSARSIPITGVTPLPAVTKSTRVGGRPGSTKSPWAWSSWTTVPGRVRRTRWLLTTPSGIAFTVTEIGPPRRAGAEVTE